MKEVTEMAQVVTIGESMVLFSPESSGPLRYVGHFTKRVAGSESNVAIGLSKLGHSAQWISRLGHDEFGYFVRNIIRGEGVDTTFVTFDPLHPTGLMFKETMFQQESKVLYYRNGSAASFLTPEDIPEEAIASAEILHISGITPTLNKNCIYAIEHALALAKKHNIKISFDPNIRLKLWGERDYTEYMLQIMKKSDILLLGLDEAERLLGSTDPDQILETLLEFGASHVALKDGRRGAWIGAGQHYRIPPLPCQCLDPIGAGDAFAAAFLAGILEEKSPEHCGYMGAAAGAMATQTTGDIEGYSSREQLDAILTGILPVYR